MVEIKVSQLHNPAKFIGETSSIYFSSILTGETAGVIWADQVIEPSMLLVWSPYQEGFQLMGSALEKKEWPAFRRWFGQTVIPFMKENNLDYFEYGTDQEELAEMMKGIFENYDIYEENQKILYLLSERPVYKPEGEYRFERVDEYFLQKEYLNLDYVSEEIVAAYGNVEHYLKKGYGYVALKENEIVARAIMTFLVKKKANISVDTCREYRKKGLSAYLTSLVIKEAKKRNQQPIWDCSDENTASEKTAKKCGFQLVGEDIVYGFSL